MERFVTDVALVSLFSGVSKPVVLVIPLLVKSFATEFARERAETLMTPHVRVESRAPVECFATSLALVRLLVCVDDLVSAESRGLPETFATNLADERPCTYTQRKHILTISFVK